MMNKRPPRIWISNTNPKKGELLRVRAQIEHIMESGFRQDESGKVRPRHIVTQFEARFGPGRDLLLTWEPGPAISRNPFFEFTFLARESGDLHLHWKDDTGATLHETRSITVAG